MQTSIITPNTLHFRSTAHPGDFGWSLVYARSLVTPLATCMLPVMILTLVAVLESVPIIPGALWGAGGAIIVASLWTTFRLQREIAEVHVSDEFACVRSVWDVLKGENTRWQRVLDVRDYGSWMHATIGLATYEFDRDKWPRHERLLAALAEASR